MDINELKQILLDEISKTELLIKEYQELTKPIAPDVAIGRISRMDAINNKSVTEAAMRQAKEKLRNLLLHGVLEHAQRYFQLKFNLVMLEQEPVQIEKQLMRKIKLLKKQEHMCQKVLMILISKLKKPMIN